MGGRCRGRYVVSSPTETKTHFKNTQLHHRLSRVTTDSLHHRKAVGVWPTDLSSATVSRGYANPHDKWLAAMMGM